MPKWMMQHQLQLAVLDVQAHDQASGSHSIHTMSDADSAQHIQHGQHTVLVLIGIIASSARACPREHDGPLQSHMGRFAMSPY